MDAQAVWESDADLSLFRVQKFMYLDDRTVQVLHNALHPFAKAGLPGLTADSGLLHEQINTKLFFQLMYLTADG